MRGRSTKRSSPLVISKGIETNRNDVIVVKALTGSDLTINLQDVRNASNILRGYATTMIRDLPMNVMEQYTYIVRLVEASYNTGAYSTVSAIIRDAFIDYTYDNVDLLPGTLAAYFIGCIVSTNFSGPASCSAVCAGAAPVDPNIDGWSPCPNLAILYEETSSSFTVKNQSVTDRSDSYLFIKDSVTFTGFSESEIRQLKTLGVKRVRIIKYKNGREYTTQMDEFVDIDSLSRQGVQQALIETPAVQSLIAEAGAAGSTVLYIILVIVFLAIIYLGWRFLVRSY